jgi:hypothetical protein
MRCTTCTATFKLLLAASAAAGERACVGIVLHLCVSNVCCFAALLLLLLHLLLAATTNCCTACSDLPQPSTFTACTSFFARARPWMSLRGQQWAVPAGPFDARLLNGACVWSICCVRPDVSTYYRSVFACLALPEYLELVLDSRLWKV